MERLHGNLEHRRHLVWLEPLATEPVEAAAQNYQVLGLDQRHGGDHDRSHHWVSPRGDRYIANILRLEEDVLDLGAAPGEGWKYDLRALGEVRATPALSGGRMYVVATNNDTVHALELKGGFMFFQKGEGAFFGSIADNDRVFLELKWSF